MENTSIRHCFAACPPKVISSGRCECDNQMNINLKKDKDGQRNICRSSKNNSRD